MNKKKINAFDCICVTDVRINPIRQIEGLTHTKALAEIVFNDQLLIRGIRVVEGENGLYAERKAHDFSRGSMSNIVPVPFSSDNRRRRTTKKYRFPDYKCIARPCGSGRAGKIQRHD